MKTIELNLRFRLDCEAATEELFCAWDLMFQQLDHHRPGISTTYLPITLVAHGLSLCPEAFPIEEVPTLRLIDLASDSRRDATLRTARSEARTDRRRRRAA